jgi:hypothetical protein
MADAPLTHTPISGNGVDTLHGGGYVTNLQYQARSAFATATAGENIYGDSRDSSTAGGDDITFGRSGRRSIETLADPAHPTATGNLLSKARGLPLSNRHSGYREPASDLHPIVRAREGSAHRSSGMPCQLRCRGFHC